MTWGECENLMKMRRDRSISGESNDSRTNVISYIILTHVCDTLSDKHVRRKLRIIYHLQIGLVRFLIPSPSLSEPENELDR
jgi:hypothetical protein